MYILHFNYLVTVDFSLVLFQSLPFLIKNFDVYRTSKIKDCDHQHTHQSKPTEYKSQEQRDQPSLSLGGG